MKYGAKPRMKCFRFENFFLHLLYFITRDFLKSPYLWEINLLEVLFCLGLGLGLWVGYTPSLALRSYNYSIISLTSVKTTAACVLRLHVRIRWQRRCTTQQRKPNTSVGSCRNATCVWRRPRRRFARRGKGDGIHAAWLMFSRYVCRMRVGLY